MSWRTVWIAIALIVNLATSMANAQALTEEQVREWADKRMAEAESDRFAEDLKLTCIERLTWHPSREYIANAKRIVADRPDHPDRYKIPMWERHAAGNYTEFEYTIWHESRGSFRANNTSGNSTFRDVVRTQDNAWNLSNASFMLYDPSSLPPLQGVQDVRNYFRYRLAEFVNPFLSAALQGSERPTITRSGSGWRIAYIRSGSSSDAGVALQVENFEGYPVVVEHELLNTQVEPHVASRYVYEEFYIEDVVDRPVPRVCRYLRADGSEERRFELLELSRLDPDEFARVTASPRLKAPSDPVRGELGDIDSQDFTGVWHAVKSMNGAINATPGPDPAGPDRTWNWPLVISLAITSLAIVGVLHMKHNA